MRWSASISEERLLNTWTEIFKEGGLDIDQSQGELLRRQFDPAGFSLLGCMKSRVYALARERQGNSW
jgi:hypothetical protein